MNFSPITIALVDDELDYKMDTRRHLVDDRGNDDDDDQMCVNTPV